jgi:hypothetical protein
MSGSLQSWGISRCSAPRRRSAAPADIIDFTVDSLLFDSRSYGIVWRVCLARLLMRRERHISVATIMRVATAACIPCESPGATPQRQAQQSGNQFLHVMVPDLAKPATSLTGSHDLAFCPHMRALEEAAQLSCLRSRGASVADMEIGLQSQKTASVRGTPKPSGVFGRHRGTIWTSALHQQAVPSEIVPAASNELVT